MKLTQEQIEEIRKRAETTTPGPWEVGAEVDGMYSGLNTVVRTTNPPTEWTSRIVSVGQTRRHIKGDAENNVAFIANARQDIPALLAHIAELEKQVAEDEEVKFGYYNENKMLQQRIAELESKVSSNPQPIIGFSERDEFDELMEAMNDDEE
jgi:hypothetical protein